ncbi:zinc finger domain protein [Pavlovales sp. CCMP2436]|nr:zinc finger domain protein [Pavlovales sp. CCMP2436]
MGGQAGPKKKKCSRKVHRDNKTRHYVKDVDQIHEELAQETAEPARKRKRPIDPDLPGLGQFYSAETDRHFISQEALDAHKRTKPYKKRAKELLKTPYGHLEADFAAGKGAPDKGYG